MTKKQQPAPVTRTADHAGLLAEQEKLGGLIAQRTTLQETIAELESELDPPHFDAEEWDGSTDVAVLVENQTATEAKIRTSRATLQSLDAIIARQTELVKNAKQKAEAEVCRGLMPQLIEIQARQLNAVETLLSAIVDEREFRQEHREMRQVNVIQGLAMPGGTKRQFETLLRQWVATMREVLQ